MTVISQFVTHLARWVEARPTPSGPELAARLRQMLPDQELTNERQEEARAYAIATRAVRRWTTQAFDAAGLDAPYTRDVADIWDSNDAYPVLRVAEDAEGVAKLAGHIEARYCALMAALTVADALNCRTDAAGYAAADCFWWLGQTDPDTRLFDEAAATVIALQQVVRPDTPRPPLKAGHGPLPKPKQLPVEIEVDGLVFDDVTYDRRGDVLYLWRGEPRLLKRSVSTPEGHNVRMDEDGTVQAITLVGPFGWTVDFGECFIALPDGRRVVPDLSAALEHPDAGQFERHD